MQRGEVAPQGLAALGKGRSGQAIWLDPRPLPHSRQVFTQGRAFDNGIKLKLGLSECLERLDQPAMKFPRSLAFSLIWRTAHANPGLPSRRRALPSENSSSSPPSRTIGFDFPSSTVRQPFT